MDKNGLVTIDPALGSADGRAKLQAVITPTASPTQWSFSQLIAGIMAMLATACSVVITNSRKVFFSDDADVREYFQDEAGNGDYVAFTPTANQTGRSLVWGSANGPLTNLTEGELTALRTLANPLIDPVPQKKSAEKLAEDLLSLVDANNDPVFRTIIVDQANKKVLAYPTDAGTSLEADLPATGNTGMAEVDGDPDPSDPSVPKLPFEGGAV